MSYILDALRRADSERERGAIPGLRAQPVPPLSMQSHPGRRNGRWIWIALAAFAAVSIAALAWALLWPAAAPQPVAAAAPSAPSAESTASMPTPPGAAAASAQPPGEAASSAARSAVAAAPAATPEATARPAPRAAPTPRPAPAPRKPAAPAQAEARSAAQAPTAQASTAQAPTAQAPTPQAPTAQAPTQASAQDPFADARPGVTAPAPSNGGPAGGATAQAGRVPARNELPADIQRELPQLTVGGSMYSENPANRMLILNGQLLREGDSPAPGVVLQRIDQKSAVLEYRGHRYQIGY